ncbi:MAG: DNA polymerase I [Gammaproteobacteria bacterium]|jgi:DNA polymerase-1|nr:DNA polymerase I [Gammaproteobacteria bacterium]MBT5054523.1 DNA polymerase I [Gammaproteobacteria bacterium]
MSSKFNVILVDGSSYLFRAFHALPPLVTSQGQPTGAIKGVISMIRRLQSDFPMSNIVVVFDAKGKTFRNDLYPDYKANRPPMPDELRTQIEPIHRIIEQMGLPLIVEPGVEADDVIGTLAWRAAAEGQQVLISTGDKDMAQLVNPNVTLMNTMTDQYLDEAGVVTKFGVRPDQIIDYLALVGDTVDNIPGVHKCGPKTAVKWLAAYDSLEGVMANANEITGKVGDYLREALPHLPLSYDLATIRTALALPHAGDLVPTAPDVEGLSASYETYELRAWREALGGAANAAAEEAPEPVPTDYDLVLTQDRLNIWLDRIAAVEQFAFDTETTGLNYMDAEIVGVSICTTPGQAAYIPFGHDYPEAPEQLKQSDVLDQLSVFLNDPKKLVIGQNLKFDLSILARCGRTINAPIADTMLESYVYNSVATRHNMDDLAQKYLGRKTVKFEEIAGKGVKQRTFNQIELEAAGHYAAEDADITFQLHEVLWPKISGDNRLLPVYQNLEVPLIRVLSQIERNGVLIDCGMLETQSEEITRELADLTVTAFELAGETFNLSSPKQLQAILFEKLQLPILKKTPKGQPSTNESVLQELALDYPLPKVVITHRGLSKLKSTYTDQLPKLVRPQSGRLHTSYQQAVAATGRLSSTDPNLQNIPIRTAAGRRVRKAFIAPPKRCLLAADYSQIELRIMAHLSGDEGLTTAFQQGLDIHRATAAEVFGVGLDAVTQDQRRSAKAINFGLIYGMSAFGLSKQLGIPRVDAQTYMDLYFQRYPGVQRYMQDIRAQAADQGYVETWFGRRLYLPEIKSSNFQMRQAAERTAINAPMQGTAADIIKRAMIDVQAWLNASNASALIIMQVHDELVLEVDDGALDETQAAVIELMCGAAELSIPLEVEVGIAKDWEGAH